MFIRAAATTAILAVTSLFALSGTALAAPLALHASPSTIGIHQTDCGPQGCLGGQCNDGNAHPEGPCIGHDSPPPKPDPNWKRDHQQNYNPFDHQKSDSSDSSD